MPAGPPRAEWLPIATAVSAFAAQHLIMSHGGIRTRLERASGGPVVFQGIYSLVSAFAMVPMIYLYVGRRRAAALQPLTRLWHQTPPLRWTGRAVQGTGLVFTLGAIVSPAPSALQNRIMTEDEARAVDEGGDRVRGELLESRKEVRGMGRVTRHPAMWGVALLGTGTVLRTAALVDAAFWLPLAAFSLVGALHQEVRHYHEGLVNDDTLRHSSFIPGVAIAAGRTTRPRVWWLHKGEEDGALPGWPLLGVLLLPLLL